MSSELKYFEELKKEVTFTFQKNHPHCKSEIGEWRGQDIVDFQEDLIAKVKGRISEKWFYTHIKSPATKLPRIDMLNMLSEYCGYKNWNDFLSSKQEDSSTVIPDLKTTTVEDQNTVIKGESKKSSGQNTYLIALGAIILLVVTVISLIPTNAHSYKCCFIDIDGYTPIKNKIRITILKEGESPVFAETSNGCLELIEQSDKITFVITTPYFKPDTFKRILRKEVTEDKIQLKTDDYSLMIHYFSTANVEDWEKRRAQLDNMVSENARIFQVYKNNEGMDLYNKQEFINKMTMPLKSLRNIEIIDVKYIDNKIAELHFIQQENTK
jgi:hypothetical protein